MDVVLEYVSASCNPTAGCFDINKNNIICFGSQCSVILCNLKDPAKILKTYVEHTGQVNCVKWIYSTHSDRLYFLSGSCDKKAILWCGKEYEFQSVAMAEGHGGSITCLDCIEISPSLMLLITSSSDFTTKIWRVNRDGNDHTIHFLSTLNLGSKLVLSLALTLLQPCAAPLIACGTEDQRIHIFISNGNLEFEKAIALTGHLQWIRSLAFCYDGSDILLASASQDCYVRVWRISLEDKENNDDLKLTSDLFVCKELVYKVALESILQSHEDWVCSAHWNRRNDSDLRAPMRLITCSMDKTIIEWEIDEATGLWLEKIRVGEVGGSNLGFIGAKYSADGNDILACSFHGAFHLWSKNKESCLMKPRVTCGGHRGVVSDLCWNRTGEFLLTVGSDQTTRIHAQWIDGIYNNWYELARPQVHGYDMQCICPIDRFVFASGADEKIIRIFKASKNFFNNFVNLCQVVFDEQDVKSFSCDGACVPALGLSNKSVEGTERDSGNYFVPQTFHEPPTEDNLMQNTLWPEEQKLYGHGFEVFALACNSSGSIIASACKASQKEHADIILWNTQTWKQISRLAYHTLTVTQLAFSHSDEFLISVSRDRTWNVFKKNEDEIYTLFSSCDRKSSLHSRIIWGCSWSHDDKYFITVSRDKKACIWCLKSSFGEEDGSLQHEPASDILETSESITSGDFAPTLVSGRYIVVLGFENGVVQIFSWIPESNGSSWNCIRVLDQCLAHHKAVRRISFRPLLPATLELQVATCSEDGSAKIFKINTNMDTK